MAKQLYTIAIIDYRGFVIEFPAGGKHEKDVIELFSTAVNNNLSRLSFSKKNRKQLIADAIEEVILEMKKETIKIV